MIDTFVLVFEAYVFLGLVMVVFNKYISEITYNLVLYFTNKLNLSQVFIFKIDNTNRNSMFFLTRTFTIAFGLVIITSSLYYIFISLK